MKVQGKADSYRSRVLEVDRREDGDSKSKGGLAEDVCWRFVCAGAVVDAV